MSGASVRFSWFIWNSYSKSEITRRPLTITLASQRRAKSTTSSLKTSTSTLSRCAEGPLTRSTRSSIGKVGDLCCGRADDADDDAVEDSRRRGVITSTCPFVTGSYEPGQIAVITCRTA